MKTDTAEAVRYRVTGMDRSACAAKIEAAARSVAGVRDAKVSMASQEMMLRTEEGTAALPEVERSITGLGYRLARISADEDDDKIPRRTKRPTIRPTGKLAEVVSNCNR